VKHNDEITNLSTTGKCPRTRPISYLHKWSTDIREYNNCHFSWWYNNTGN
jgi:hypothetical protein